MTTHYREIELCKLIGRASGLLPEDVALRLLDKAISMLDETQLMRVLGKAAEVMPKDRPQRVQWHMDVEHAVEAMGRVQRRPLRQAKPVCCTCPTILMGALRVSVARDVGCPLHGEAEVDPYFNELVEVLT